MKYLLHLSYILLLVFATSCADDQLPYIDYTLSGEDVTVTVSVELPDIEKKSRAALADYQLNEVRSLWIRTYSATTGKATSQWITETPGSHDVEVSRPVDILTKSGSSYIVAVANVDNPAVTKQSPDIDSARPLRELLAEADTWQKFLDIAVLAPSEFNDVNAAPLPITMVGCLSDISVGTGTTHPDLHEWGSHYNFEPVFIPATSNKTYSLSGAIHLRRLVSHISFNIRSGNDVIVTPTSYTVVNVPKATWLYERNGSQANFGDLATEESAPSYYATTNQFTLQYITQENGVYHFDFWQGENKHRALPAEELAPLGITFNPDDPRHNYDIREKEQKDHSGANTGLYTCLTGETWTPANMASYVVINADVEYKEKTTITVDGETIDATRIGNAEYVVHLGFLDDDPSDFNCYRNVDYTYNMTINGLNDVYLEAFSTETVPGVEGLVSDVENETEFLDCHYGTFNIQLTRDELVGNGENNGRGLGYVIVAWDYGRKLTFTEDSEISDADRKFIDWVELRPTTGANVLAEYYPKTHASEGSSTFNLRDASQAGSWPANDPRFSSSGWYTVFVNEYAYEDSSDEGQARSGIPNWATYVNQPPRRFYIRVTKQISSDGQSIYARSKYAASQSSIQSYYSSTAFTPAEASLPAGTAIGIERENEMLGLNLRGDYESSTLSPDNGRYNVWQWIHSRPNSKWTTFLDPTAPQEIPPVASANLQQGPAIPAGEKPIVKLAPLASGAPNWSSEYDGVNGSFPNTNGHLWRGRNLCDPQPNSTNNAYYIEAINACMNRNRDNNGNGVIDADELRWFVPSSGVYMRLIIGSNALPEPLMDFSALQGKTLSSDNGVNTRYLYFASDDKVVWTIEGMSTSQWHGIPWCFAPWQVRCIRNLGTNLSSVTDGRNTVPAYKHDAATRIVRMTYYDPVSVRAISYSGNGTGVGQMPVHMVNSIYNMPYKAFQYSAVTTSFVNSDDVINADPCASLNSQANGTGWRVPNIKELAIMYYLGIGIGDNGTGAWTSCSVSFFNNSGLGGSTSGEHKYMGARYPSLCQIVPNLNTSTRCVRDYIE